MVSRPVRGVQLATLVDRIPEGNDWLHEQKYDGYRILALRDGDQVQLLSRRFNDWTDKFRPIASAIRGLDARHVVLDGEVAVVLADGRTSFQALQGSFSTPNPNLVYFAFDLLAIDNEDLRALPLETRKQRLAQLVPKPEVVRYSEHIIGNGPALFRAACERGLEGIVSKRRDRPYEPGRGTSWVKTKCVTRQELGPGSAPCSSVIMIATSSCTPARSAAATR
ncbi:MAG: hypothetical protein H0T79_13470 [Deltaproteobacteria bacterium]|nr:hypothetical protein [Deltaproteobacteria bacterium]